MNPVFVVQVENGNATEISATDLADCLQKIEGRTGFKFSKGEVVHTFGQTDSALILSGLEVPYEEPSRIQDNKNIKIVFFKENLSTGWDCPRAETMMSFRRAKDATYIAQLLGRMVRTPMQMHIQIDDSLNDVHLFLPFFEKNTVEDVIEALQSAEGGNLPTDIYGESIEHKKLETLTVRPMYTAPRVPKQIPGQYSMDDFLGSDASSSSHEDPSTYDNSLFNPAAVVPPAKLNISNNVSSKANAESSPASVEYPRASVDEAKTDIHDSNYAPSSNDEENAAVPGKVEIGATDNKLEIDREKIVKAINDSGLLTYDVRSIRINDYLKSLFALTRLLAQTNMDSAVYKEVHAGVIKLITDYIGSLKSSGQYEALSQKAKEFKLSTQVFDVFGQSITSDYAPASFFSTNADIDRQFRAAETKLGSEGIGNEYLNAYFESFDLVSLKIDVILFATDDECIAKLNAYAKQKFHELNDRYRRYMTKLTESYRKQYDRIVSDGDIISKHNFRLPETITVAHDAGGQKYFNHLFVNDESFAQVRLNDWEQGVLEEEETREDFVCWLRNPPRTSWSLCIPYEQDGETKPTYPDFIVIRKDPLQEGQFIIDVLEPHNPAFNDNLGKAKGFAEYARQNPGVGRIELIRKAKDAAGKMRFKRLDMSMSSVRDKVLKATTDEELVHLFETDGK
ncbi:hypothetical protein KJY78_03715 [Canibacter sp. lx-45]|uniref:hypothetical protein n=1 Tax=Canibacter zhuwentaonis TaxID=2837491 RepID=UPI001BDD2D53|nr:hypothetical protein [Canibacter zhuwentaonis]MBT1035458.1 hypothetical protein [Canibacter zhuwentaonis]